MTKLCFVSSYPPLRGRLSEYAYNLINELEKCPTISHVDLITETANNPMTEKLSEQITAHKIWKSDSPLSLLFIPLKIMTLKPDVVHFNVHMAVFGHSRIANFVGLCMPFLCKLMGFKTVVTLHNIIEKIDVEKTGFKNTLINRFSAFVVTKLIALTSAVTLTMKSHTEFFKARYNCKNVKMIPHGTWKNISGYKSNMWIPGAILYMGHSGPYKDLTLLLDAFQILEKKRPEVRLTIGGTSHPNYPGFLEKYEVNNPIGKVRFIGYIPESQLSSVFEKANVIVLPYFTCTGTSGIAHLASSFGTPIVATDLPEFRELAREGCGLLLSPHRPQALADTIEQLMDNPNLAYKLKDQNYYFADHRSWDTIAARFCNLYEELMGTGKR